MDKKLFANYFRGFLPLAAAVAVLAVPAGCSGAGSGKTGGNDGGNAVQTRYEIKGNVLVMDSVPAGTTKLGTSADYNKRVEGMEIFQVLMSPYLISSEPVSQALWQAVMGKNPSSTADPAAPVDRVTYLDAVKFTQKLSKLTGAGFTLPTEAQWEYAYRKGQGGIDGNAREWCLDGFSQEAPGSFLIDPATPADAGGKNIVRTVSKRDALEPHTKAAGLGFHVALATGETYPQELYEALCGTSAPGRETLEKPLKGENVSAGGAVFKMVAVPGGTFEMGATYEQGKYGGDDEIPVHKVNVSDFKLSETEVTASQWKAVMGWLPYGNEPGDTPVVNVSWYDCQEFLARLNSLTGRMFRLPTEAEWEYAARGGARTAHYRYSGSNQAVAVASLVDNTAKEVVRVKSRAANELGLYDMSGNAWEWCYDIYGTYPSEEQTDPWGAAEGSSRVMRGGSAASRFDACRVSNRSAIPGHMVKSTFGFRIAL